VHWALRAQAPRCVSVRYSRKVVLVRLPCQVRASEKSIPAALMTWDQLCAAPGAVLGKARLEVGREAEIVAGGPVGPR
jgi:hypothetical protein